MRYTVMPQPLAHEWLCGIFMVSLWIRLVWATGPLGRDALFVLLALVLNVALLAYAGGRDSAIRWRLRLLFYPITMNLVYFLLATAVPSVHTGLEDAMLQSADLWLVGAHPGLLLEAFVHPVATEILSFCYLWYLFYLFSSQVEYLLGPIGVLKRHYAGLFSIYAIGYVCYSLVPALGPHLAMAGQFSVPLEGGWFTRTTAQTVLAAGNGVDVFPSLHVAVSVYLLLFDRRQKHWRFRLYLLPCVGLVIATIYLRYHYLTDVLCGLALSFLALRISRSVTVSDTYMPKEVGVDGYRNEACPHHGSVQRNRLGAREGVRA